MKKPCCEGCHRKAKQVKKVFHFFEKPLVLTSISIPCCETGEEITDVRASIASQKGTAQLGQFSSIEDAYDFMKDQTEESLLSVYEELV